VSKNNKANIEQRSAKTGGYAISQSRLEMRSGPMPDAEELARYEAILPGAAERIFVQFEEQVSHRHNLERMVVESGIARSRQGLVAGFIISMTAMGISALAVVYKLEIVGSIIGGSSLVGLVTVFVTGSRQQKAERAERDKASK
jgi:uncharacterized membrane protein